MATAMQMVHAVDPKEEIMADVRPYLDNVRPLGTDVLLAVYIRPTMTKGGIMLVDTVGARREDNYQGKCHLVLAMGPAAFVEDERHKFGEAVPKVGDWVAVNVAETWAFELGNRRCRTAEDIHIKLILKRPDIVW